MIQGVINKEAIFFGAWDRTWKPCGRSEPRQAEKLQRLVKEYDAINMGVVRKAYRAQVYGC